MLKQLEFAARSEAFNTEQRSLLGDAIDEDLAALTREIEQLDLGQKPRRDKNPPKRQVLPLSLPLAE